MSTAFHKTEDFASIVAGGSILLFALISLYIGDYSKLRKMQVPIIEKLNSASVDNPKFKSVVWFEAFDELQAIQGAKMAVGNSLQNLTDKPGTWRNSPLESMRLSATQAKKISTGATEAYARHLAEEEELRDKAIQAMEKAHSAGLADEDLNTAAENTIDQWRIKKAEGAGVIKKYKTKPFSKWGNLLLLFLFFSVIFGAISFWMKGSLVPFFKGFVFVFALATFSHFLAGQASIKDLGIGYAAWAILLGLVISNTIGTAAWIKPALETELYIKTGLVILGAEILMSKVLAIGLPGIFVAWVVTPIVLISTYWFGQKVLKIRSKTLNMTISADMSVCGVSAAVATAAACKASKEELTLAVGLSMVFTSVMMVVMPLAINALGMPEVLGGAWMGGTIDATGAVVAAGAFLGNDALNVAATIKMIQNILIGVIAFGVAIYFTRMGASVGAKIGAGEIWRRFPKFVLGFIGASIVFSLIYSLLDEHMAYSFLDKGVIGGFSSRVRGWLFCLAFVSIGLSTNFKELKRHFTGGKPFILYVCGQAFNLILTLTVAYIMFYLVFPEITESI